MTINRIPPNNRRVRPSRRAANSWLAGALIVLTSFSWHTSVGRAQQPPNDDPGSQVQTRAPVHEALAGMITFNPEAGVIVANTSPELIAEMTPEERRGRDLAFPGWPGWSSAFSISTPFAPG